MASLKLIIMGMGGVGKSAITTRFTSGQYTGRVRGRGADPCNSPAR